VPGLERHAGDQREHPITGTAGEPNPVDPAYGQGGSMGIQDVNGDGIEWQVDGNGDNVDPNVSTFVAVPG
jgi:hypothetical protein